MRVRDGGEKDLEAILAVERSSFPEGRQWTADDFRVALQDMVLVSASDGEVAGFLVACCRKEEGQAVILRVAVHPDHRGRGVAEGLLRAAIARCAASGVRRIEIDVEVVKQGARRLYEKVGFSAARAVPMRDNESMDEEDGTFYLMSMRLDR